MTTVERFSRMRSGHGFRNDLRTMAEGASLAGEVITAVTQPALVVASRRDGAVPFVHAESLVARLPRAELVVSEADSHFLWFSSDYPAIADQIRRLLTNS